MAEPRGDLRPTPGLTLGSADRCARQYRRAVPSWRHDEGVSQQRTQTSRPVQYSNGELCSKGTLLGAAFVHAVGVAAKGSGGLSVRLARVMGAGRGQSAAAGMRHDGVLVDLPGQAEGSVETVRPES